MRRLQLYCNFVNFFYRSFHIERNLLYWNIIFQHIHNMFYCLLLNMLLSILLSILFKNIAHFLFSCLCFL